MTKANIKIPKGTKCANGEICDKDLELDIEIPETKPTIQTIPEPQVNIPQPTAPPNPLTQAPPPQFQAPTPEPEGYTTEELAGLMPSGVNYAVCKGNNCADSVIQNKKQVTKFKTCPKCGCNNVAIDSSICPCCGKTDNDEEDYWEDSDIEIEADEE